MALVGGVSLCLTPDVYIGMCGAGMLSADGQCKTFDASANGFVPGEGVGALVLKRLADAEADHDQIHAVIIGSGINQDGATNGITAPSVKSQIGLVREVYEKYHVDPDSISYVEMHGTGTKLGDPIELEALSTVFQEKTQRKQFCAIGSVKTNIGHTLAAAGVAGLHKVLLAMKQKKLVPSLHFEQPNPHFDFAASPFYVNTTLQDWNTAAQGTARRATVSSFGFSGTNAHIVLEEYMPNSSGRQAQGKGASPFPTPTASPTLSPNLFVLSARSEQQLISYAQEMKHWIQAHEELALPDIAFTLQMGRQAMEYRLAILADSREMLLQRLDRFVHNAETREVVGIGGPGSDASLAGLGVPPNPPISQKVLGFCNKQGSTGLYTAQVTKESIDVTLFEVDKDGQSLLRLWCQKKNLERIAQLWVRGVNVDWMLLYTVETGMAPTLPHRVSLPTYPFARESYWVPARHSQAVKVTASARAVPTCEASSPLHNGILLSDTPNYNGELASPAPLASPTSANIARPDEILTFTTTYLANALSTVLKISPEKLDRAVGFDEYGLDSIIIQRLHANLTAVFGPFPATTFFEYKCISDLAQYFLREHKETLHALFQQANQPANVVGTMVHQKPITLEQDIAIIGISGQYPQAESLDAFWHNLAAGKDCIVEIPQERWDYHTYYQPENGTGGKTGGMYCKWGGFLSDIDAFDPSFFHISPLEARLMDPQERLFLQIASACLEDAGYGKHRLRDESAGDGRANVGVFAGVTYNAYQLHLIKEYEQGNAVPVNSQTYSIANRVSYIYNLRGPSVVIDTACSSSLFAIHLACESIKKGECAMAIAGGVNLSLHPSKYISLCVAQFASSDGHCRSFGQDGDGYVPGEGVGAVLLKPLRAAVADGDHIYAVIKGTAVNNDGKTFGYSVPNPVAQTEVISKALEVASVDPRTISYIEAHGTGTKLGDPIEITGLSNAFKAYTSDKQYCAIGSVKSNIGHLEAAAGISQVAKVVLQMKHKQLAPSLLHTVALNPHIDFENTPFFVQQTLTEWKQPVIQVNGEEIVYPRRAGISSFGAGGVNVHLVLEEYQVRDEKVIQREGDKEPVIIVLSAQKEANLRAYAQRLKAYMAQGIQSLRTMATLKDLAYTLQTGRDAMSCRLAFTARDPEEIIEKLSLFLNAQQPVGHNGLYIGYGTAAKKPGTDVALDSRKTIQSSPLVSIPSGLTKDIGSCGFPSGEVYTPNPNKSSENALDLEHMAELWANGREIDWESLYQNERRFKVSLPTYPFSKERYWVGRPQGIVPVGADLTPSGGIAKGGQPFDGVRGVTDQNLFSSFLPAAAGGQKGERKSLGAPQTPPEDYRPLDPWLKSAPMGDSPNPARGLPSPAPLPKLAPMGDSPNPARGLPSPAPLPKLTPEHGTFLAELCQALEGERQAIMEKYLQDVLAKLLAFHPPEVPELHQGFFDMGMESVMVEQLRVSLAETFMIEINENALYEYPNISALSAYTIDLISFLDLELHQSPDISCQEETGFLDELALLITDDIQEVQAMDLKEVVSELQNLLTGNSKILGD